MRTPSRVPDRLLERLGPILAPADSPYHEETPRIQRRRRFIVTTTLVGGAVLLGFALTRPQGSDAFYVLAGILAGVWLVGGLLSGPVHLGRGRNGRRPMLWPALVGALAFGVFAVGAEAVSWIPSLHHAVDDVIKRADTGSRWLIDVITIVNGIGEEVFFRGSVYSAFAPRHPALWTTISYVIVTAAAGNLMLVLAAALMGTVFALERRATRGILAPAITHVVWSTMMIFLLPR
ncbi:MAG TPA: type II CAAX endopeptidase family protein [Frankiaceae bacterium]|nr:type II CAAX endopeptidase family protein [Frankiaceae bacterium]